MDYLEIKNSDRKNIKILILDHDLIQTLDHEVKCDNDIDLRRLEIFSCTSLSEALNIVRKHEIALVLYRSTLDSQDFVQIQLELTSCFNQIKLAPFIKLDSILRLNESLRVGNIYSYEHVDRFNSFEHIKNVLLRFIRDSSIQSEQEVEVLEYASVIMRTNCATNPHKMVRKDFSSRLLIELLPLYDLSNKENLFTLAAEKIYDPIFSIEQLEFILNNDKYFLLSKLKETGSWINLVRHPKSVAGFLITLSNYISEEIPKHGKLLELINIVLKRPSFIFHPAIRNIDSKILETVISSCLESSSNLKAA